MKTHVLLDGTPNPKGLKAKLYIYFCCYQAFKLFHIFKALLDTITGFTDLNTFLS